MRTKGQKIHNRKIDISTYEGAWSAVIREPIEQDTYIEMAMGRVKNTCWVWRENGPLEKEWREKVRN